MNKKLSFLGSVIVIGIIGFFMYQENIAKPNVILDYIDETDYLVIQFNTLYEGEAELLEQDDADLSSYSEEVIIPGLKEILADSMAYSEGIENAELKEVHDYHTEAINYYIKAEEAWNSGEDAEEFFLKGDEFYSLYEKEFEKLATKMNVELEWE